MAARGLYLQWEGKRVYRHRIPKPRLLEPNVGLSVGRESDNRVIEGDNLQVLASLRGQYAGEVNVIYIDPPYNLGKEDFLYSDKRYHDPDADDSDAVYVTNEDGGRHTKWLNFMAPRLYMLREVLSERGVIFVSINDVELFRLGLLMNEIFGEDNWIGTLVWKGTTDNNPTRIAVEHEYILCYAKNKDQVSSPWVSRANEIKTLMLDTFARIKAESRSQAVLVRQFQEFTKENKTLLGDLYRYRRVDSHGPYAARRNMDNPGKPGHKYKVIHPVTKRPCAMPFWGWRFTEARMKQLIKEGRIIFGKDETKIPELKVYLDEVNFPFRSVIEIDSRSGSNDLEALFGSRDVFKNPKPVALIKLLLGYSTGPNDLVLDAFAGSGTTGHAVLALNEEDGGKRRFILIEEGRGKNGRDRFARTLTSPRLAKAIKKYKYASGYAFYTTGRKVDREAIVGLEREALANLICQSDETGRGVGVIRLKRHRFIIGKNPRGEALCLVWNGNDDSEVTRAHLSAAAEEVTAAGLKRPFRIYGTFCRIADTGSWKFCQIPDEILAQMHIDDDAKGDE